MFNKRCSEDIQIHISSTLGTNRISLEPKYLGLPTPDGRMKSERFQAIQERLSKRLLAYTEKELSMGGKEIMIKVVGQAYIMSIFKLQDGVCELMEQTIRIFWWGTKNGKKESTLDCLVEIDTSKK